VARDVLVWGEICLGRRIKGGRDFLAAGLFEAMFFFGRWICGSTYVGCERFRGRESSWREVFWGRWFEGGRI
jgi:hypothetical protein